MKNPNLKDILNQVQLIRELLENVDYMVQEDDIDTKELDGIARKIRLAGTVLGDMAYEAKGGVGYEK